MGTIWEGNNPFRLLYYKWLYRGISWIKYSHKLPFAVIFTKEITNKNLIEVERVETHIFTIDIQNHGFSSKIKDMRKIRDYYKKL